MRRHSSILLALLCACSGGGAPAPVPSPVPLVYRPIGEGRNGSACVDAPDFAVAPDEDAWIDVWDRQTGCGPQADVQLPQVDFRRRVAIAAWWSADACPRADVETTAVSVVGDALVVRARTIDPRPGRTCEGRAGTLESFLIVLRAPALRDVATARFELDGEVAGTIPTVP